MAAAAARERWATSPATFKKNSRGERTMRTSTKLKIAGAGGLLGLGSLLFAIPGQANAADSGCYSDGLFWQDFSYVCAVAQQPTSDADLIHFKLRGHSHQVVINLTGSKSATISVTRKHSENIWFRPSVYTNGSITLADKPPVYFKANQNTCFKEDKHGYLVQATTGSNCTAN
jgi:hypothetical protein